MKIAILGNFDKEIRADSSGGTEVFTYELAEELAKRESIKNIDVYGVGESFFTQKKINFISILPSSIREFIDQDPILTSISKERLGFLTDFQSNVALKSFSKFSKKNYDVIHNNSTLSIINSVIQHIKTPIVTTIHTNIDSPSILIPYKLNILQKESNNYFVSITNHQKIYAEQNNIHLNIIKTIYNGIALKSFHFTHKTNKESYGLWIGRINRKHNKGLKEALLASKNVDKKLTVLTSIDDEIYYKEEIKPHLTSNIELIQKNIELPEKNKYYANAAYLIYPIMWEEPFGLVFIESMACGTPIIAYARGSVPEIIKDGETGFIVNSSDDDIRGDWIIKKTGIEGLCEAVERIYNMPNDQYVQMRKNCRDHVEKNFTVERMVDEYEKAYQQILNK